MRDATRPKTPKPGTKNLGRGVVDINLLVTTLNDLSSGAGDQLRQAVSHLNARADAQAGHSTPVGIAKQTQTDSAGNLVPGLKLEGNRISGVADPLTGSDAVNLDYFRAHDDCDWFLKMVEECLKLPKAVVSGIPECWQNL